MMLMLLADTTTTLDKLKQIPPSFWGKIGLAVLAVIVVVLVLRSVFKMNKFILAVVTFVVVAMVGFSWIYQRNEPAFLTPIIDKIAPFFPSQGAYGNKQQQQPK